MPRTKISAIHRTTGRHNKPVASPHQLVDPLEMIVVGQHCIPADIDGKRLAGLDCWAVLVGNGRTNAGCIEEAPEASPSDGMLDTVMIKDGSLLDMVEVVTGNVTGNFLECDQIIFRQAKRLQLPSEPPTAIRSRRRSDRRRACRVQRCRGCDSACSRAINHRS